MSKREMLPSNRLLCKFYARGACRKGDHCEFSHDLNNTSNKLCTFYQRGVCSYGSRCRYDHVKVSRSHSSTPSSSSNSRQFLVADSVTQPSWTVSGGSTVVPSVTSELSTSSRAFSRTAKPAWIQRSGHHSLLDTADVEEYKGPDPANHSMCPYAAAGSCPRGKKCPHVHGDLCPSCGKHCLHPFRPEEREKHMKTCEKERKHLEALTLSQEIECSVCLERVLSKPTAAERKFGLLSDCEHPFCISCIKNWRSSSPASGMDVKSTLRACPICRKVSYFVVPSAIWFSTKEEKLEIVDNYKAKLRSIDCKHFNFGNGTCQFGASCFYKHTVKPGSYLWNSTLMPEIYSSSLTQMDSVDDYSSHTSPDVDSDCVHVLFKYLYKSHSPLGMQLENDSDVEDSEDELAMAEEMALFLTLMGFQDSDDELDLSDYDDFCNPWSYDNFCDPWNY